MGDLSTEKSLANRQSGKTDANKFRFRAGHLDLGLDAAKPEAHVHFSSQLATMNVLLREYKNYKTTVNAVLNMKGTLLYYMHEYELAIEVFLDILSKDKTNLNALKNLELLYKELGLQKQADKCVERERAMTEQIEATVRFEQAFAIIYDCHVGVDKSKGFKRARDLFEECVKCSSFNRIDLYQCKYWYAQLEIKDGTNSRNYEEFVSSHLRPIVDSEDENLGVLRGFACTLLGQFHYRKLGSQKGETAETFEEAKSLQREVSKEFMVRYSLFLLGNMKEAPNIQNLEKAKKLMDKCTQLDSKSSEKREPADLNNSVGSFTLRPFQANTDVHLDLCWFPYSVKCKVYLRLFQAQCQCFLHAIPEQKQYECPFLSLLDTAIEEGEKCAQIAKSVELFNNIGIAYHQKAKHETYEKKSLPLYEKALSHFLRALRHLDGTKQSYVHISHGECLMDIKEFRPAVECFKRAINSETKNKMVYHYLLDSYISLCVQMQKSEADDAKCLAGVLNEASHWLRTLSNKSRTEAKKCPGKKLKDLLDDYMEDIKDNTEKFEALARVVATLFIKCENCNSNTCRDKFLKDQKRFAARVLYYTLHNPHIDRKHLSNIIRLYDDDLLKNNCPGLEQDIAKALLFYRHTCCRQDCNFLMKKFDYRAIQIFREMNECFPEFSRRLIDEVKLKDSSFASVLSHHADKEGTMEMPIDISSGAWTSEVLAAIHREIRNEKPNLSTCLSDIENHLLNIADEHFEDSQLIQTSKKAPRCRQSQFEYDFFVLHNDSEDDKNFVQNDLVPTLEERYGFRGCFQDRDFTPGKSIFHDMEEKMEKSYKILVILSQAFTKDQYCEFFLNMAIQSKKDSIDSVLHIQTEEIDIEAVPCTLKTKVPIKAVKKFDIERLTRALENTLH